MAVAGRDSCHLGQYPDTRVAGICDLRPFSLIDSLERAAGRDHAKVIGRTYVTG